MTLPKDGGMGIRDFQTINDVCAVKKAAKYEGNNQSILRAWIKTRYIRNHAEGTNG